MTAALPPMRSRLSKRSRPTAGFCSCHFRAEGRNVRKNKRRESVGGGLSMSQCCLLCQPGAVGGSGGSRAGGGWEITGNKGGLSRGLFR